MDNLESNGQPSSAASITTKIDMTSVGEEKLSATKGKAEGGEDTIKDAQNNNMDGNKLEKSNASLGDSDDAVAESLGEEKRKEDKERLENTTEGSKERAVEDERKVEDTPKKAKKRKRIKSKTPSDAGDAGANISRSDKIDSVGEKKGENDDEKKVTGNNLKKANRRKKKRIKRVTLAGAGTASAVSVGEEKLILEEKGVSTPKKSNRLEGEKTAQVASVDAVAVISKGEERVGEDKGIVENIHKKAKRRRSRAGKRGKKNTTSGDASDAVAKNADQPETSGARKDSERAKSMGMIFICNSTTKPDCFRYKVLGLPASKKDMVVKIYEGMRLFLYDTDFKLLYGIYKAAGPGGYNIEHKAFNSAFPSQVRFTILDECLPLPEETFKAAIKDNYYTKNKFSCELTAEQVKNLCKLFHKTTKDSKRKRGGSDNKREVRSPASSKRKQGGSGYKREIHSPVGSKRKRGGSDYKREVYSPVGSKRKRGRIDYRRELHSAERRGGSDYKREVRSPADRDRKKRGLDRVKRAELGRDYAPTRQILAYERESFVPQPPPQPPPPTLQWLPYERESYTSRAIPPHPPPQSYVYEQPAQMSYYRSDPQPDLHDPHYPTHSELRRQSETRYRDSNVLYQEPVTYRDSLYPSHVPPGYYPRSYRY